MRFSDSIQDSDRDHLTRFSGVIQADAFGGYEALTRSRPSGLLRWVIVVLPEILCSDLSARPAIDGMKGCQPSAQLPRYISMLFQPRNVTTAAS
jgi:hypothetical protein